MPELTLREKLLNRKDIRRERVALDLGELGAVEVEVRAVTLAESDRIEKARERSGIDGIVQFLLEALYDPATNGKVFKPADREALSALTQGQVAPLVAAFGRVSAAAVDKAEVGKGSGPTADA
jgi:hypothetical protein